MLTRLWSKQKYQKMAKVDRRPMWWRVGASAPWGSAVKVFGLGPIRISEFRFGFGVTDVPRWAHLLKENKVWEIVTFEVTD